MLTLYRRHTTDCLDKLVKLPPKARRLYMDCQCPIWIYGRTSTAVCPRRATGTTDLKEAEALRASLDAEGKKEAVHGPTIDACAQKFLLSRQHAYAENTYGVWERFFKRFKAYCHGRGIYLIRELTVDLLESFKHEGLPGGVKESTRRDAVDHLRAFLREAFRRGWILEPLVERIERHPVPFEQKHPYTDEEVQKILEGAENWVVSPSARNGHYAAEPHTFRLLLELMLETGMRVSDAVRYNPRGVRRGECSWVYEFVPKKTKKLVRPRPIEAYIPGALKLAIDECTWLSKDLPFLIPAKRPLEQEVWMRMQKLGKRCGVEDCRPHRLRDTFAVRYLLRGIPLEDVSRLLGHSSVQTTERYYAAWVPARKLRLERLLAKARSDEALVNA